MQQIERVDLECGLPIYVERLDGVQSAGLTWLLPLGSATDDADRIGTSPMLSEWIWRGAGGLDAKAHSEALDRCGAHRSSHVETYHLRIGVSMIGKRLNEALPLMTALVTDPGFEDGHFQSCRDLALQALDGLRDNPNHRSMLRVKQNHHPAPFNRTGLGEANHLRSLEADVCRDHWSKRAVPGGSILAVCGDVDCDVVVDQLNDLLSDWTGSAEEPSESVEAVRGYDPETEETAQVHIGLAHDAPAEPDEGSMLQRVATAVLSGGMSGRLFTEVRERRSLCYAVHATYASGRDRGALMAYAGTTPQRAQETLDVMVAELKRLREGVDAAEFDRARAGLKSRFIMHGESTAARAGAAAHDHFLVGSPRTLDQLARQIDAITLDQVNAYVADHPYDRFTMATIGPEALDVSSF